MRIGVFDSGIGGLTVLKKLIKKYPNNEYIYYGDTKNIPFGDKNLDELKFISSNIIEFLISKKVDVIVIACGTVSSNLAEYLRNKYSIPIYDIISGMINHLNESSYNKTLVLCTQRTKDSKIFNRINKKIKVVACPNLVDVIERNDTKKIEAYIKTREVEIRNSDAIILGCTHYPLIKNIIKKYTSVPILDMADYIKINNVKNSNYNLELYFSKEDDLLLMNVGRILKK